MLASYCGVNAASGGGLESCSSFAALACTALQAHGQVQLIRVLKVQWHRCLCHWTLLTPLTFWHTDPGDVASHWPTQVAVVQVNGQEAAEEQLLQHGDKVEVVRSQSLQEPPTRASFTHTLADKAHKGGGYSPQSLAQQTAMLRFSA